MSEILAGRYELGAQIGAGGMARVCEAYDRTLARRVAVKLLHAATLSQPGMRERFLHEARAAASFSHPHAVAIYDTGRDNGVPYIVMELVEGPSLATILADRGALGRDQSVAVAGQVLAALGAAHRRGLVHRDVKPANVLLPGGEIPSHPNGDPPAKLADFGIAKGLEEAAAGLTATGQVLGTPKYVSPEQVSGQPATPRSDVYSAGIMLYEMLAGRPPFEADTAIALALAHREDPVPRIDRRARGVDRHLAAVVHRALEKDPARRFMDASEMRAALVDPAAAIIGGGGAVATRTAVAPEAWAPTRPLAPDQPRQRPGTSWRPIAVVAALALALLLVAAVDWTGLVDRFLPGSGEQSGETGEDAVPGPDEGPADPEDPPPEGNGAPDEGEPPPDEDEDDAGPPPDEGDDNGNGNENGDPPGQNGDPPGQNGDPPGQSDDNSSDADDNPSNSDGDADLLLP